MFDDDEESLEQAYGYSIGEIVQYKTFLKAKIVGFKLNDIVLILLWDPDGGSWSPKPIPVSVNDCE